MGFRRNEDLCNLMEYIVYGNNDELKRSCRGPSERFTRDRGSGERYYRKLHSKRHFPIVVLFAICSVRFILRLNCASNVARRCCGDAIKKK